MIAVLSCEGAGKKAESLGNARFFCGKVRKVGSAEGRRG
jgi:hypothetical protein